MLVTSHDAFGYFGRAYGFEVIGLQGVSTASEVGTPRARSTWPNSSAERQIPAVFTETSVPEVGLKAVLDDVTPRSKYDGEAGRRRQRTLLRRLGEPGTPGGTYPGMIRHNVKVIVEALTQ